MFGSDAVIRALQEAAVSEVEAVNQYASNIAVLKNLGLAKLVARFAEVLGDEREHLARFCDRLTYFDQVPELRPDPSAFAGNSDVREILVTALRQETDAIDRYQLGVELAVAARDSGTRALFESILVDEEEHANYWEMLLRRLDQIGEALFIAQQV